MRDSLQSSGLSFDDRTADGFTITGTEVGCLYDSTFTGTERGEPLEHWLRDTELLQVEHPKIRCHALRLTQLKVGELQKALACYHFVRSLPYSFALDAAHTPSIEVLGCGTGDALTKSTLFTALLRALAIPSRVHVVELPSRINWGLMGGSAPLFHAFGEVRIHGKWVAVDSYVVDRSLALVVRAALFDRGIQMGYGAHQCGSVAWDGMTSAFGHFSSSDPASLPLRDHGVFHDVRESLEGLGKTNWSSWSRRAHWAVVCGLANQRLRRLRKQGRESQLG